GPVFSEFSEIVERLLRHDRRRQGRRVGGHDEVLLEAAFQTEPRYAERLILEVAVNVMSVEGALGNSPGDARLAPIFDLAHNGRARGFDHERAGQAAK